MFWCNENFKNCGGVCGECHPNGALVTWEYEPHRDLMTLVSNDVYSTFRYTYDAAGKRVSKNDERYTYNVRGELVLATNVVTGAEFAYRYDDIGNRLWSREFGTNCTYVANELNQYTNIVRGGVLELSAFDLDGNQTNVVTSTGGWSVTYNGENRPVRWHRPADDTAIRMAYDRMGRRVVKNDETFVYDNYLNIGETVWDPTEPVATRPLMGFAVDDVSFYYIDGNKNVREMVASVVGVVSHYYYTPFGRVIFNSAQADLINPWQFSSEHEDDITDLVYFNYRYYDSLSQRWLSRDPAGMISDYRFCDNCYGCVDFLGLFDVGRAWRRYKCYLIKQYLDQGAAFSQADRNIFNLWLNGGGENSLNASAFDPGGVRRNAVMSSILGEASSKSKDLECGESVSLNYSASTSGVAPAFSIDRLPDITIFAIRGYGKFEYSGTITVTKNCDDCECKDISREGAIAFNFEDVFEFQDSGTFFFGMIEEKTVKACAEEFGWGVGKVHSFASDTIRVSDTLPCGE